MRQSSIGFWPLQIGAKLNPSLHYEVRIWRLKKISALLWPLTAQCIVSCTPWNATYS